MPRACRITVQDEPEWVRTPAQRRRWRRVYAMGLLAHLGFSSRFIADAFREHDSTVRRVLRSENLSLFKFPKTMA
jgi:hypothetical protein